MAINITTNQGGQAITQTFASQAEVKTADEILEDVDNTNPEESKETTDEPAKSVDKKEKDDLAYLKGEEDEDDTSEDESDDEDLEDDEEDEPEEPVKHKNGIQKRFNKLTKTNKELETALIKIQTELEVMRRGGKPAEDEQITTPAKSELVEPQMDDFDSMSEFYKALTKYENKKAIEEFKQEEAQRVAQERLEAESSKAEKVWVEKRDSAKERYKDWDKVIANSSKIPLTPVMKAEIMSSEVGPDIVYYLCRNPEKAQEIANATPMQGLKLLARLETRLEESLPNLKGKQKVEKTTNAPDPVKPIKSASSANTALSSKDQDKMSYKEYKKVREQEMKSKK